MTAIQLLLQAALDSAGELCSKSMGMDMNPSASPTENGSHLRQRTSIAVSTDRVRLQLSLSADMDSCAKLAKAMLGANEDDEIDAEDVTDGVGEMMNIIAGGVKQRLNESYPSLKVGLPISAFEGPHETDSILLPSETRSIRIGDSLVQLKVMVREARNLVFPEPNQIVELFGALTSDKLKTAKVGKEGALEGTKTSPLFAGLYQGEHESAPSAAMVLDRTLAGAVSGSLCGFPPALILEDLKSGQVTDELRAVVHEILNILTSLLNSTGTPRVRLADMSEFVSAPKGRLAHLLGNKPQRLDLDMTVAPCPSGRLVVVRSR